MNGIRKIEHGDIVHRCFRCGYCKFPGDYVDFNCPSYKSLGWDTFSPGGRMWLIRAWLSGEITSSRRFAHIMFSCATCDNCKDQCVFPRFKDYLPAIFRETRAALVEEGMVPPEVRDFFKALSLYKNPYRLPPEERNAAVSETGLPVFNGHEYLYYIGCVGSYDEVGRRIAASVGRVLAVSGLSIGILGAEEACDGNDVMAMGEQGLFQTLAEDNIGTFKTRGVRKIITLDPHAYNTFKNDYPRWGGVFDVYHYTEILAQLLKDGTIRVGDLPIRGTYHDPCYLGRHNRIYTPPREILGRITGSAWVEMRRHGPDAFCCGGGGGNFFTDLLGSHADSPARVRVREAKETGASIIATACTLCAKMLTEASKAEGGDGLTVLGVSEIMERAGVEKG